MDEKRLDFAIQEAGCLIWVAPRSLGGLTPDELGRVWMGEGGGGESVKDLVLRGALMPMSLYQDDGYLVRFVLGDLTEREEAEWTARASWRLEVPCGQVLVSGILGPDFEDDFSEMAPAEDGGDYWAGCYVEVPAGAYGVEVYGYPPGDLSSGWGQIENPSLFTPSPGIKPEEPLDYFRRTRPAEEPPRWIAEGYDPETYYVNFVVRLRPTDETASPPQLEEDGCVLWEFRKPEICPAGLESNYKPRAH